jgi:hypothetical protein
VSRQAPPQGLSQAHRLPGEEAAAAAAGRLVPQQPLAQAPALRLASPLAGQPPGGLPLLGRRVQALARVPSTLPPASAAQGL